MKIVFLAIAFVLTALTLPASATSQASPFTVQITLTSKCEVHTIPTAAFTYTSFQTTDATISSSFNVRCTNTLPITSVLLDNGAGGVAAGLSQSYTDQATNLQYTLVLSGVPATGNGADQSVTLTGTMGLGQAGTCAAATCNNNASTNKQRTITIAY